MPPGDAAVVALPHPRLLGPPGTQVGSILLTSVNILYTCSGVKEEEDVFDYDLLDNLITMETTMDTLEMSAEELVARIQEVQGTRIPASLLEDLMEDVQEEESVVQPPSQEETERMGCVVHYHYHYH